MKRVVEVTGQEVHSAEQRHTGRACWTSPVTGKDPRLIQCRLNRTVLR